MNDDLLELNSTQLIEGILKYRHNNYKKEKMFAERLLEIADNGYDRGCAYAALSDVSLALYNLKETVRYGEMSIAEFGDDSNGYMKSIICNILATAYSFIGNTQKAIGYFIMCLEIAVKDNDNIILAAVYSNIATLYYNMKGYDRAAKFYMQSLELILESENNTANIRFNDLFVNFQLMKIYINLKDTKNANKCFDTIQDIISNYKSLLDSDDFITNVVYMHIYDMQNNGEKVGECIEAITKYLIKEPNEINLSIYDDIKEICSIIVKYKIIESIPYYLSYLEKFIYKIDCDKVYIDYYNLCIQCSKITGDKKLAKEAYKGYFKYTKKLNEILLQSESEQFDNVFLLNKKYKEIEELKIKNSALAENALRDALTGIYNRLGMKKYADKIISKAAKENSSIGVIILDVDFFKEYNDTYGHQEGDNALKNVAECLEASVNNYGIAVRYGGDEFIALIKGVAYDKFIDIVTNISEMLKERKLINKSSNVSKYVTVSTGAVFGNSQKGLTLADYIHYADKCLYFVKNNNKSGYMVDVI